MATPDDADNLQRWDGSSRGHYEVWYLTFNHRASGTGYWIRYTLEAPLARVGEPYAQLWFARFDAGDPARTFAINRRFPIASLSSGKQPFSVAISDAELTSGSARGSLAGGGHEVSWKLSWTPSATTHRQLPSVMYRGGGLGDTTVLTPNLDVALQGELVVDGERLAIEGDPGGQTHLWGRKHAHAWAWGHCNDFDDAPDAALETLTVRLKRRGLVLPPMTVLCLYAGGKAHRFNQFHHVPITGGDMATGRYRFWAHGLGTRLEGEFQCRPEDMVVAEYHDPDGEPSWCANTEVADLRVTLYERTGLVGRWRESQRLLARKTGHFEIASRERDPAIKANHVTV